MLGAARLKRFTATPVPSPEHAGLDFFGVYAAACLHKRVEHFRARVQAFEGMPNVSEVRNRVQWGDTYGGVAATGWPRVPSVPTANWR
jgi:hypothetical protein